MLLPIMVLILLGTIECTSMIFLQQSLEIVCYETVRTAARPQSFSADAQARATEIIADRSLNNCTVTINPPEVNGMTQGAAITVTATAGTSQNAFFPVSNSNNTKPVEKRSVRASTNIPLHCSGDM